jgi:GGDEF domain-containing protein
MINPDLEKSIGERNSTHTAYTYLRAQIELKLEQTRSDYNTEKSNILDLLIQESQLEHLKLQYDPTGVLNYYANKSEVRDKFTGRNFNLSSDNPLIHSSNEDQGDKRHLIMHTLPCLILINSQEGHNSGNNALSNMGDILTTSQKQYPDLEATTYHMRGADFLTFVNTDKPRVDSYIETTKSIQWPKIKNTNQQPYLLEETTTLDECIEIFNNIQSLRKEISPELMITEEMQVQDEVLKIGETILTYKLEFKKAKSMLTQFWDIYQTKLPDQKKYLSDFYSTYLRPYLYSLNISTFEGFVERMQTESQFIILELAWRRAINSLGTREDPTRGMAIQNYIENKLQPSNFGEDLLPLPKKVNLYEQTGSANPDTRNIHGMVLIDREAGFQTTFLSAINLVPPRNEDTREYKDFYNEYIQINQILDTARIEGISVESFWQLINLSGLAVERQIGDFIVNPASELYTQLFLEEAPDREEKFLQLVEHLFINKYLGRDQMTLHPNRETLFKASHERIRKAIMSYDDVSMTSLDMGFINYYNQEGCRNTGNQAILYAFNLLNTSINLIDDSLTEEALTNRLDDAINQIEEGHTIEVKRELVVYRYAGDELAFNHSGDTNKLRHTLKHINRKGKAVKPAPTALPGYIPLKLQFNYGITSIFEAEELFENFLNTDSAKDLFSVVQLDLIRELSKTRAPFRIIKSIQNIDIEKCITDEKYREKMKFAVNFLDEYVYGSGSSYTMSLITEYIKAGAINWNDPASIKHAFDEVNLVINAFILKEVQSKVIEELSVFQPETLNEYAQQLLGIMIKTSDEASTVEKVQSRFELLFEHYVNLPNITDLESDQYRALLSLITYSSKALKTISVNILDVIAKKYHEDKSKTPWEHYQEYISNI